MGYARLLTAWAILFSTVACPGMERVRFAHNPALSPDGRRLAYDWKGDIWVVPIEGGQGVALTYHPALDANPCFSPDGEQIVWSSNRSGNWDIYLSSSYGGTATRLTWHPWPDGASDFTPDGQAVLFASPRYLPAWSDGSSSRLLYANRQEFLVPVTGGTPQPLQAGLGSIGKFSPDGQKLVFVRGGTGSRRRGYRGAANDDLWLHDLSTGQYTQLTTFDGVDTAPVWSTDGQSIYFISDRSGVRNVWQLPLGGGEPTQITFHDTPVTNLTAARQVPRLVYECDDQLYRLDLGQQPEVIEIGAPADDGRPDILWQTLRNNASEFAVAPSGKEVAFVVRGDAYVCRFPAGGYTRQLTNTPATEGGLCWSPDSKTLWFHADRAGQYDLYTVTSDDPDEPRLRHTNQFNTVNQTNSAADETRPLLSPDGKQVAFIRNQGDLVVADTDLQHERVLSRHWMQPRVAWAPTSDWLAFSQPDENFNSDVFIVPAAGGDPVNVSQHPAADWYPVWSGDGSKLAFLSARQGDQVDAYFVWLRQADWERTRSDRSFDEDLAFDKPKPAPKPAEPGDGKADPPAEPGAGKTDPPAEPGDGKTDPPAEPGAGKADPPTPPETPVKPEPAKADASNGTLPDSDPEPAKTAIDLEKIHERLVRLTRTIDNEDWLAASPDGKSFVYSVAGNLQSHAWESGETKSLASNVGPSQVRFSADGKRVDFLKSGGAISTVGAGGGAVTTVEFTAEVERDLAEERLYLYDSVWRIMRDIYYDPQMHGVDWAAVGERHRRRAELAPTDQDFVGVVEDLLGELNSSHVGYSRSLAGPRAEPTVADLGITWALPESGPGLTVAAVVPGSPASKADSLVKPGETVLAIDGVELSADVNVWSTLRGKIDRRLTLQVADAEGTPREVVIRPSTIAEVGQWRYETLVGQARSQAETASDGKVGYLHIRAMDQGSLEDFERDLYAAGHGREALIVDVRWNGGGWIADNLLGMLTVQPHAYTVPRDGQRGYPNDRRLAPAWSGPTVLMANATSVSNAEILAHAFKTLKRGPVVGETTYGGVISTGSTTLVDGSRLRLPFRGWYRLEDGQDMEHHGAEPDVAVPYGPADEAAGQDPQLAAAIQEALKLLAPAGD